VTKTRRARPDDELAIQTLHRRAFGCDAEARLVELLAERGKDVISLVAERDGHVAGHILFSPATIEWPDRPGRESIRGLGLAPVAVLPEWQRQGIGSALVTAGLGECRQRLASFVVLIGHPDYYPRFGFVPAGPFGLTCAFGDGPAFQILWLADQPRVQAGVVRYAEEFYELFAPPA
jgi:putative acetyltransferase